MTLIPFSNVFQFTGTQFAFVPKKDMTVFNGKYVQIVLVEMAWQLAHNTCCPRLILMYHVLHSVSALRTVKRIKLQRLINALVIVSEFPVGIIFRLYALLTNYDWMIEKCIRWFKWWLLLYRCISWMLSRIKSQPYSRRILRMDS